jgi:MerR family transcriptional regulator, light-induced transcriptional regulator
VILPFLHRLGERWAAAQATVAQEHFASNIIAGRLRGLARGWGQGVGPRAVLACPPGELHELGLLSFGLALRERGWRITYLGADTPLEEITDALDELAPAIVVLAAMTPERFLADADALSALATRARVGLAGAGASGSLADGLGAELLAGELMDVAAALMP